jgi:hypothetical protein
MTFIPELYEGNPDILIPFKYNPLPVEEVKKIPGRMRDAGLKSWYVPDTKENRARFGLMVNQTVKAETRKSQPRQPTRAGQAARASHIKRIQQEYAAYILLRVRAVPLPLGQPGRKRYGR